MITVVNRHHHKPAAVPRHYVGRPTILGNPYNISKIQTRDWVVDRYAEWLASAYRNDPAVHLEIEMLIDVARSGDLELECFCAPRRCHADVIRAMINERIASEEVPA